MFASGSQVAFANSSNREAVAPPKALMPVGRAGHCAARAVAERLGSKWQVVNSTKLETSTDILTVVDLTDPASLSWLRATQAELDEAATGVSSLHCLALLPEENAPRSAWDAVIVP